MVSKRPPPKGLWPAVTGLERIAFSRLRLYELYDGDNNVQDRLTRFYGEHWQPLGPAFRRLDDCLPDLSEADAALVDRVGRDRAHEYLDALTDLGQELGLDRIATVGTPPATIGGYLPSGIAQAHRYLWHLDKALLFDAAPVELKRSASGPTRPTFVYLASFGTAIPAVDTSIAGTDARWDPRSELLADARRRLREAARLPPDLIESELDRIAGAGSYQFPDTSSKRGEVYRLDRDAWWVWWRIRHRWTYEQIARRWERLHPDDFRMQYRLDDDDEAREWAAQHPEEARSPVVPQDAVGLVRKAVTTFAGRARVDVRTGPGRRGGTGDRPRTR